MGNGEFIRKMLYELQPKLLSTDQDMILSATVHGLLKVADRSSDLLGSSHYLSGRLRQLTRHHHTYRRLVVLRTPN